MHCTCGNRSGYSAALHDPPEGKYDFNYDFWVCADCKRPSRLWFEQVSGMRIPTRATQLLSEVHDGQGRIILRWATAVSGERIVTMTFRPYPRKPDMPARYDNGRDLLLELWRQLDEAIVIIKDPVDAVAADVYKTKATTLAEVISLIMLPFYPDKTAVLKESQRRWQAKIDSVEHESPGLAEGIWDQGTRFDGTPYAKDPAKRTSTPAPPKRTGNKIPDAAIETVKQGIASGMFTAKQMADSYKMTVEELKQQVGLD